MIGDMNGKPSQAAYATIYRAEMLRVLKRLVSEQFRRTLKEPSWRAMLLGSTSPLGLMGSAPMRAAARRDFEVSGLAVPTFL